MNEKLKKLDELTARILAAFKAGDAKTAMDLMAEKTALFDECYEVKTLGKGN